MKLFKNKKIYYFYNPNTLNYERVYPSAKDRFFGILRHLSIGIVIGVGVFFLLAKIFDSPIESLLKKEKGLFSFLFFGLYLIVFDLYIYWIMYNDMVF